MTLHEAIAVVLKEAGRPLTKDEIANEINANKLYQRKKDNKPLPAFQVGLRVKNYPKLFKVCPNGTIVLNDDKAPVKNEKNDPTDTKKPVFDFDAMIKGFTKPSNRPETKLEDIKFRTIDDLKKAGFTGFQKVKDLRKDSTSIPMEKGVYMVVRNNQNKPSFLAEGSGGYFKGKEPNVPIDKLERKWIDNTCVIYIGQTGGGESHSTLRERLELYLEFGNGEAVAHRGGRYIWQLSDHENLLFCWKTLSNKDPKVYEWNLMDFFEKKYGALPFANLKKG